MLNLSINRSISDKNYEQRFGIDVKTSDRLPFIIVVDDDEDMCELLTSMLVDKGYNVKSFTDARSAIDHIENNAVDIVISDIIMPGIDGLTFCETIKTNYHQKYFILLSSKDQKEDVARGLSAGADDYIVKPFDSCEFIARVNVGKRIFQKQNELNFINYKLEQLADTDSMTDLKNRRYLISKGTKEISRAKRYNHTVAGFMIDVDNFKSINDIYGHFAGDYVLKKLATILKHICRDSDIVSRYGGEEFFILLPESLPKNAFKFAEKIRQQVDKTSFNFNNEAIKVTISIGVSVKTPDMNYDLNDLISCADKGLYKAKNSGKNQTILYKSFNIANLENVKV